MTYLITSARPTAALLAWMAGLVACTGATPDVPPPEPEAEPALEIARATDSRAIKLHYQATLPASTAPGITHLWLPLPRDTDGQRVRELSLEGATGERVIESTYGNAVWHVVLEDRTEAATVGFTATIDRQPVAAALDQAESRPLTEAERATHARDLLASSRVPVGDDDPVLEPILADLRARVGEGALPVMARTLYDHVIDTMEYKKVGTGWGNGDTYWACSEKYGNCTDFHSLYLSLARTEGIPARFEMGFPIPSDRSSGTIGGYHCWLQLWLPGAGWVPLDASEADKHPEQREAFYGAFPADRVLFTIGRDLRLGPDHKGDPLNYFIYPYAEVDGTAVEVEHEVSFEAL